MAHYTAPHLTVEWDRSLEAVVMNWHDFAKGEDFREGLEKGLELVERKGARNWLADLREMGTVSKEDQRWTNEEWHPRAFRTSLSNMAIIQPENVVANMSVENMVTEIEDAGVVSHVFDNRPEAESWLQGN